MIKTKDRMQNFLLKVKEKIRINFKFATLNFMFIILFVNVFQKVFGVENSIVGVIFAIMMSASMARDLTSTPIKHFFIQAAILVMMACSACIIVNSNSILALFVNFITLFIILYAFTYEYTTHLYFPYILSYLFLIFISPIDTSQLPKRISAMLTGAVCIILYQLVMGRNKAVETAKDVLLLMLDEAYQNISFLLNKQESFVNSEKLRQNLCRLSRLVYERRKKTLQISDASLAMLDTGRGLENLILSLNDINVPISSSYEKLLSKLLDQINNFRSYINGDIRTLPSINHNSFFPNGNIKDEKANQLYENMKYIQENLLIMTHPKAKKNCKKSTLSIFNQLKIVFDTSSVRVTYALRVSIILTLFTFLAQSLSLPHGKWLLFTIASVSLPYAEDFISKAKKRFVATALGGIISVILYSLLPSSIGRTAIMMLSGYVSFYFSDYTQTFTCSTIGAIGGAVSTTIFGFSQTAQIILIRISYVLAGILIGYIANCIILPYKRDTATIQLWNKYATTTKLLTYICREKEIDLQLYYNLVIKAHLQEDKLYQNSKAAGLEKMQSLLYICRNRIRAAHCNNTFNFITS